MSLSAVLRTLDRHPLPAVPPGSSAPALNGLLHASGQPHRAYPTVLVGGSAGKGSTVEVLALLLRASGLSVATFTRSHVDDLTERITWDGRAIPGDELAGQLVAVEELEALTGLTADREEVLAVAAYRWFADLAVDVAVVEHDPSAADVTADLEAEVVVIPAAGDLDPERLAAPVGPGSRVVTGSSDEQLVAALSARTVEPVWVAGRDYACEASRLAVGGRLVDLRTPGGEVGELFVPVHGAHQSENVAAAVAGVEAFFGRPVEPELVAEAVGLLSLPGRFEVARREPLVVLDTAATPEAAATVAGTVRDEFTLTGTVVLVVGLTRTAAAREVLEALDADDAGCLVACTPDEPGALPGPELAAVAEGLGVVAEAVSDPAAAVQRALALAGPDDVVVVTGSPSVAGAARGLFRSEVPS